jgi:hypothetical protein
MNYDLEINSLSGETLAIQGVLASVLCEIAKIDSRFYDAIKLGMDNAASKIEDIAIRLGKAASPEHSVKAIRVVEELRTATLGNPDKPRRGV